MEREQKLFKDTLIYMVANFGAKILILIIYPVYTYYVLPVNLGTYDLIISTLTLIYPIIVFSINDAVFRWLLDYDSEKQLEIISIGLKITIRNIFIIDIIYIILNLYINIRYGWLILAIMNFGGLYPVLQQIARGLKKNKIFAMSGLLYAIILVVFNIVFVILFKFDVEGLLLSQALAYAAACTFLVILVDKLHNKWWVVKHSKEVEISMIKYSLMLIPNSCCWWIMNALDRYLIRFFIGSTANGIYAISHKFPSVLNIVTSVFALAWQEQAITEYSNKERDSYYSKIYRMYYLVLFCICLLLLPVTKWVVIIFIQSDYRNAWKYSAALYLGSVFLALASFLGTGYLSVKNTKGSMVTSMAGAAVNIIVDLVLLPITGLEAAAISTFLGNLTIWLVRWFQLKKCFTIKIRWHEFVFLVSLNIFVGIIIRRTTIVTDIIILIISLVITIIFNHKLFGILKIKIKK